jgi:glucose-1-phosphate adenylyltransferase
MGLERETVALILAGGNGTRLGELTRWQCKPAITFGGHFRNIDFTLSNCVNSGVRRIAVLTQYKAQSLINHIGAGWNFLPRTLGEFVEIWPAQQRLHSSWYLGTADAVHQNLDLLIAQRSRYTLVLAGDHVYKMDYRRLLEQHASSGADVTVACVPVPVEDSASYGVLGVDDRKRVCSFIEKPLPSTLGAGGGQREILASMGVYVFNTGYLVEQLRRDAGEELSSHDFGRDILPKAVKEDHVAAFAFTDASGAPAYWRDVGTVDAYWQAHMELLAPEPPFELYDPAWPIITLPEQLPPAKLLYACGQQGFVANALLAGGVVVRGATVTNSVLAGKVQVDAGTLLDEVVALPGARIGANCRLRRVIIDAGVEIPNGTCIGGGTQSMPPLDTARVGGRITLVSHNWTVPVDEDEMRSVA